MAVNVYRVSYDRFGTAEQRRAYRWRMALLYGGFVGTIVLAFMWHDIGDPIQMIVDAVILYSAGLTLGHVMSRVQFNDYELQISDDAIVVVRFRLWRRTFQRAKITSIREKVVWPFRVRGLVVSDAEGFRGRVMGTAFIPDFLPEYPQIREELAQWKPIEAVKARAASH